MRLQMIRKPTLMSGVLPTTPDLINPYCTRHQTAEYPIYARPIA